MTKMDEFLFLLLLGEYAAVKAGKTHLVGLMQGYMQEISDGKKFPIFLDCTTEVERFHDSHR